MPQVSLALAARLWFSRDLDFAALLGKFKAALQALTAAVLPPLPAQGRAVLLMVCHCVKALLSWPWSFVFRVLWLFCCPPVVFLKLVITPALFSVQHLPFSLLLLGLSSSTAPGCGRVPVLWCRQCQAAAVGAGLSSGAQALNST